MKKHEATTRYLLPRRTYTILRVDGRAFHTWTRGLRKPYDREFIECMDAAAVALCEQVAGAQFAFVQSDEVSLLAADFAEVTTEPWFDAGVQKWASVGASIATMAFNARVVAFMAQTDPTAVGKKRPTATFDGRVFPMPDLVEVENYFVWRQQDAERNSVQMMAQAYESHRRLAGKNRTAQLEIIQAAGDDWAGHPGRFRHGAVVCRSDHREAGHDLGKQPSQECYKVGNWFVDNDTPLFTRDRAYLRGRVPLAWEDDLVVRKKG